MDTNEIRDTLYFCTSGPICSNRRRRHAQDPIDGFDPETFFVDQINTLDCKDSLFMLLNLILDLASKLAYQKVGFSAGAGSIDPQLAARMAAHRDFLNSFDADDEMDWEARALWASRIFVRDLAAELDGPAHDRLNDAAQTARAAADQRMIDLGLHL